MEPPFRCILSHELPFNIHRRDPVSSLALPHCREVGCVGQAKVQAGQGGVLGLLPLPPREDAVFPRLRPQRALLLLRLPSQRRVDLVRAENTEHGLSRGRRVSRRRSRLGASNPQPVLRKGAIRRRAVVQNQRIGSGILSSAARHLRRNGRAGILDRSRNLERHDQVVLARPRAFRRKPSPRGIAEARIFR